MKKVLDLKFYSATHQEEDPIVKSIFYSGKYENHIRLATLDDITPTIYSHLKQSYLLL
jgi:hypothetical protein